MARQTRRIRPPRLRPGDTIGLISPASTPSSPEKVERAVGYFERQGYRVRVGPHTMDQLGYLAGSDADRAADLNAMIADRSVRAIVALRGGYGTPRILDRVNYRGLLKDPKIIVGYSDLTALQLAIHQQTGLVTFSGPMAAVELWNGPDPYTEEWFWRMLTDPAPVGVLANPPDEPLRSRGTGIGRGILLGGNLSLLVSLLGTPFSPRYTGSILVLEEVDEAPHRVDRMFAQLRHAGIIRRASALVLGRFTDCNPSDPSSPHLRTDQVLDEVAEGSEVPVLSHFQYGHIPRKITIPLGVKAEVRAAEGILRVLEPAVS